MLATTAEYPPMAPQVRPAMAEATTPAGARSARCRIGIDAMVTTSGFERRDSVTGSSARLSSTDTIANSSKDSMGNVGSRNCPMA